MKTREIKFRAYHERTGHFHYFGYPNTSSAFWASVWDDKCPLTQLTGLSDCNGVQIYEGDILEFTDKWEWYRSKYGVDMMFAGKDKKAEIRAKFDAEPMERRAVSIPDCYEEFSTDDLKSYWQIVGNVFENPDLIAEKSK